MSATHGGIPRISSKQVRGIRERLGPRFYNAFYAKDLDKICYVLLAEGRVIKYYVDKHWLYNWDFNITVQLIDGVLTHTDSKEGFIKVEEEPRFADEEDYW